MLHFSNEKDILDYSTKNPTFLYGFTSVLSFAYAREGCFTAYLGLDLSLKWMLQPNCEFSITQSTGDIMLLQAINQYFGSSGAVYDRKDGVSVMMVRNLQLITLHILPFFYTFPLVGSKSYEYERWFKLVQLIISKQHLGSELFNRDIFIEMAYICKELNAKVANPKKIARLDMIIDWLKQFSDVPTKEEKEVFNTYLGNQLKSFRKSKL